MKTNKVVVECRFSKRAAIATLLTAIADCPRTVGRNRCAQAVGRRRFACAGAHEQSDLSSLSRTPDLSKGIPFEKME
jgi:hypothetical protein